MEIQHGTNQLKRGRKGQTLAEFALTLPILLILMFGIVEFGRIFQAWVTLQNAARAAARYASTGQYFEDRYPMRLEFDQVTRSDPTGFIPCVNDGPNGTYPDAATAPTFDARGTKDPDFYPNSPGDPNDRHQIYTGGLESIFATWNDGLNCDTTLDSHQEMRKDMARIFSIMDEARRGAAGLLLEADWVTFPADITNTALHPLLQVWKDPMPRSDQRSWFNVTICSDRDMPDEGSETPYYSIVPPSGTVIPTTTRFITYLGDVSLRDPSGADLNVGTNPNLLSPSCLLNEIPIAPTPPETWDTYPGLNNAGKPWLDPGGPSDTVVVIVTFNHPLVTPLGLAEYIQMQARRTAIVESFRSADPRKALPPGPPPEVEPPTPVPTATNTTTPVPADTATKTNTPAPNTATPTPTTPPDFTCELLTASDLSISGGTVSIELRNQNAQSTFLTRVIFKWPTILNFPGMYVSELALNFSPHWVGVDMSDINSQQNTTDTAQDPSDPPDYFISTSELDRTIDAFNSGTWSATLAVGPTFLENYVSQYDFQGTTFYLYNPTNPDVPCEIRLDLPEPTPSPTFDPNRPTNTPTFTPDCASAQISVRFGGFEAFGIVRLEIRNERAAVAPLTDFLIQWIQRAPGVVTLDRVTVVAPYGQSGSVLIWESGSASQDSTPPTAGRGEGVWVRDYTVDAGSPSNPTIVPLYIDFGGVGGLLTDIGVAPSDFNGTRFRLGCGQPPPSGPSGPSGPGWSGGWGDIFLSEQPTPAPTPTRGPSNTPRPTLTPSKTFTPGPPTATRTPGPTATPRPATNTPRPPTATTPPPPPTPIGGGCTDGCD